MAASPSPRVLLLDAQLRHGVAIVRSLGERGVAVIAAGPTRRFPARFSRHVEGVARFDPAAERDPLGALRALIEERSAEVVIAAGLPGNELLCRHRDALAPLVRAPFNDLEQFRTLSNKLASNELARSLDVPQPRTATLHTPADAGAVAAEIGFPMVVKSPVDQGTVRYPANVTELRGFVEEFAAEHPSLVERGIHPIAQEYIAGEGHGFYALADHGRILAHFMHRRLHEVPPSGGASAMACAYRDPVLLELGTRFFTATGWHGVAMVEFKRSARDGRYYLIEVNPKFWGSLALSITAGVDFPYLLYLMLTGAPLDVVPGAYRDDAVFRWLTMDLAYAAATRDWGGYVRRFRDAGVQDDFDRGDPLPTLALFAKGVAERVPRPATVLPAAARAPGRRDGRA